MTLLCFLSPPQELEPDKVCDWIPLEGWIASERPFREIHLVSPRAKEEIAHLDPMPESTNLPPELAAKFRRRFKSRLTVEQFLGDEGGTIIAKVVHDAGAYDLVKIDLPAYRFRQVKIEKRARIRSILACPFCRKAVIDSPDSPNGLHCRECGRSYGFSGNSFNFLTDELKAGFSIVPTGNVSDHGIGRDTADMLRANPDKLYLDMGAGLATEVFANLVNFEIADYPSTDVLGVGERLPFLSESFDFIKCDCVLEHVKDPFACAREMMRVLKPGGTLHCSVPFLQPEHGYPNHFYNMTRQGLINLFEGLDLQAAFVPDHLHPITSLSWILKSYLVWLPHAEKHMFANMTIREFLDTFPMGSYHREHPIWSALPKERLAEIASGNTIIATKPGTASKG